MSDYQFHVIVGLIWLVIAWVIPVRGNDSADGRLGWGPTFAFVAAIAASTAHFVLALTAVR